MNIEELKNLQKVAESAAVEAGEMSLELQSKSLNITKKGYRNFVSEADLASQQQIMRHIGSRFPEHDFLSEEAKNASSYRSSVIWIIDPIDGTTNYIRGQPLYTISVAAAAKINRDLAAQDSWSLSEISSYEIVAGAIYDPHSRELFSTNKNTASTLNEKLIQVSAITETENTVVAFDWSRDFQQREKMMEILGRLAHNLHTLRANGSAAQALAWVACGRLDLYFNLEIGPWDAAAAKVLIERAGGCVTDLDGKPWGLNQGGLVASNGAIHEQFLDLLNRR